MPCDWNVLFDRGIPATYYPTVLPVISAKQMREIDRLTSEEYGVPSRALMQAAANACFLELNRRYSAKLADQNVRIVCGPGNNGGDGAALAQLLSAAGAETEVILLARVDDTRGDARTNFDSVQKLSTEPERHLTFIECKTVEDWKALSRPFTSFTIIVDALLGTGLSRPLEGIFAEVVHELNAAKNSNNAPFILSVDIPSGLDSDSYQLIGPTVAADLTVTFTAPKVANVVSPASHLNGRLVVADIGSPALLLDGTISDLFVTQEDDVRRWLIATRYTLDSFKNTHGHVLVIAGSRGYTGAAVLCGNAAMRAGAGLTTIATPNSAHATIAATVMAEVMTTALAETDRGAVTESAIDYVLQLTARATVVAIGPGLTSEDERTRNFVHSLITRRKTTVVVDADALNCLAPWSITPNNADELPIVLTPHPGEMLRLLGTTDKSALNDRVAVARSFATRNHVILVLKGSPPLIAAPDGRVFINPTGNPGLGTAGAGDTLTGLIAGFLAQEFAQTKHKPDVLQATIAALYVGGLAGDLAALELGMRSMMASDIRGRIGDAICLLDPVGEGCSE
ncbi:MAG TPA: NAD(P)H-hydrate dehydratase [Pyrinomonadaceae bacterium]|nr:NAD(P)H-hydrate dehydratase [Pyrinomonadaceae bacterium]